MTSEDNTRKSAEALAHLDALQASPAFAWFMHTVLEKARDDEREKALLVNGTAEDHMRAVYRYDLARELCGKLQSLRATHEKTLRGT